MSSAHVVQIVCLICMVSFAASADHKWPADLKRCSINDPHLNKCLMKLTQQGILAVTKGIPEIGLPSLEPIRNISYSIETKSGPVVATVHTSNVEISGQSKVQLRRVEFDKRTSTYWVEGYHPLIRMIGEYKVEGTVLTFPIDSTGTFEFVLRGGLANHTIKLSNNKRDGSHGKATFDLKTLKSMKMTMKDKTLGEQASNAVNSLVNHNWEIISSVLWDPMEKINGRLIGDSLRPLTRKFLEKDFFPVSISGKSDE